MDGSLAVAIAAVLISAGSLAVAVRADRRAARAEARGLRAVLSVEPSPASDDASGRRFDLRLRNVGDGVARQVRVWLEDESGRVVSTVAGGDALTLVPGDDPVAVWVTVRESALPPPPVSFPVLVSFADAAGTHPREDTGVMAST